MEEENISQTEHNILAGNYNNFTSGLRKDLEDTNQLLHVISDNKDFFERMKLDLYGQQPYTDEQGNTFYIQVDKPFFVVLDENDQPKKIPCPYRKNVMVDLENAINSILTMLKFSGLNHISPFTNLTEEEITDDLMEIESKLAVLLANKRKKWGLDIAEYPIAVSNLKTIIKDARYRPLNGNILKAIRSVTQRIERALDSMPNKKGGQQYSTFN